MTAARVQLVAVLADLPARAQALGNPGDVVTGGCRPQEPAIAFENARRAGEPDRREIRCQETVAGRFARVQVLAHRAVGVEFPEARRLRAGGAERVEELSG
jgi:hypothetical protein